MRNNCKFYVIGLGKFTSTTRIGELMRLTGGARIHTDSVLKLVPRTRGVRGMPDSGPANSGGAAA